MSSINITLENYMYIKCIMSRQSIRDYIEEVLLVFMLYYRQDVAILCANKTLQNYTCTFLNIDL